MEKQPVLYMMLGYPGAGKTTTAKTIAELTGAIRLSSDDVRLKLYPHPAFTESEHQQVYNRLDREVEVLLKEGKTVIYDANLNRHRHRQEKYDLAGRHGVKTVLIWVTAPKELAKQRRMTDVRQHHLVPPAEDPASMFNRIVHLFEPPYPNEPYVEIDGTLVTPDYVRQQLGL